MMEKTTIGIRDLKARLSEYLKKVKSGESILITEHGRPIGRITPLETERSYWVDALIKSGLAEWSGKKPKKRTPIIRNTGQRQISDILSSERE